MRAIDAHICEAVVGSYHDPRLVKLFDEKKLVPRYIVIMDRHVGDAA
jgi:hypothetical protein